MQPLRIEPVEGRAALKEFAALPRRLYEGMPGFEPPLDLERLELIDARTGPFFDHGRARFFIARRGAEAVGRISAQIDPAAPAGLAGFGCLDAADDREAVASLFAAAEGWARGEGATAIRGPFMLSINGEVGLLVEGREEPPMTLMPWHPAYLEPHVLAAGYGPAKDLLSFRVAMTDFLERTRGRTPPLGPNVVLRGLDTTHLADEIERFRLLFNEAWAGNWGFVPMQPGEAQRMGKGMKPLLFRDSAAVVEVDGEVAAFALLLPNLFELGAGLDGRLLPFGWATLAWRYFRQDFRSARVALMGIRTRYRSTPMGAMILTAMFEELARRAAARRIGMVEMSWILEDNRAVIGIIRRMGGVARQRFRLYDKALDGGAPAA